MSYNDSAEITTTGPLSGPTGATLSGIAVYTSVRTMPESRLHLIFDCQLFLPGSEVGVSACLRYFNRQNYTFDDCEPGVFAIISAAITKWRQGAPLYRTDADSERKLDDDSDLDRKLDNDADIAIIGDIHELSPISGISAINVDTHAVITACGMVTAVDDRNFTYDFDATQYTSFFPNLKGAACLPLPIRAQFELNKFKSKNDKEKKVPLPPVRRIVWVNGRLIDVLRGPDRQPLRFVLEILACSFVGYVTPPKSNTPDKSAKRKFTFGRSSTPETSTGSQSPSPAPKRARRGTSEGTLAGQ